MSRRLKNLVFLFASVWIAAVLAACGSSDASESPPRHSLFQASTLGALSRGIYDVGPTIAEIAGRGDFGVGTFDDIDGEMVVLDGVVYQVRTDGVPRVADPGARTPFVAMTDFVADERLTLDGASDYADLQAQLDGYLSTLNVPVAIRINGRIPTLSVRSVPAQTPPYPPLADVVAEQTVFDLVDVSGTLVGFRMPAYLSELNVAGHHFHFISDDRRAGGHVLAGTFDALSVELQYLRDFEMWLPEAGSSFDSADLDPEPCEG